MESLDSRRSRSKTVEQFQYNMEKAARAKSREIGSKYQRRLYRSVIPPEHAPDDIPVETADLSTQTDDAVTAIRPPPVVLNQLPRGSSGGQLLEREHLEFERDVSQVFDNSFVATPQPLSYQRLSCDPAPLYAS